MPSKKPARAARLVQPAPALRLKRAIGPIATLIAVALVTAGGILVAARQQSQPVLSATPRFDAVPMPAAAPKSLAAANGSSAVPLPPASSAAAKPPTVTLAGCLEREGDDFRLNDVTGADAPKARSWKSGFLKKGKASVDVVDATHALRLADQVGRRVSVTGALADRELKARSLRRVAASCGK